jgi:hypothetical protein
MGISQSRNTETINWNNVKTDDMSSTLPNLNKISDEAKQLITKLNLPEISDNNSEFDANFIFNEQSNSIFNTNINNQDGGSDHEENNTSPFITSEMYNYIINKYNNTNVMTGGAAKKEKKLIGGTSDDDNTSETSSTSSSVELSSSESSSESTIKEKKEKKGKKDKKEETINHELSSPEGQEAIADRFEGKKKRAGKPKKSYKGSENYLSYVSSSAHTDEYKSVRNENNYSISSVNTSDINMISDN